MRLPSIPASWGEIIDKITILEIKMKNIGDEKAKNNVSHELSLLNDTCSEIFAANSEVVELKNQLSEINSRLWQIEDDIREKEAQQSFDDEFVELARSVYKTNDLRAAVKREINVCLESEIVEEKSYRSY